ncbi:MAG TPA: fused MFS/spermidine synthase [Gemmatimonadales bacterium]|nr:fused MFS/spermidine synthase [Gemmatimonadales bacterium]
MRSRSARAYTFLFFLSGATGLIYELLWVRVLYQSFGSTIQSVTTVVAAYMGGLGLGAWLLGRIADRSPRPAVLYGWLEIAIGVFGAVSPLVLALAHRLYIGTAGSLALGGGASVALRFGLAAIVLLIPTTLMGGTLPVLTRALMGEDRGLLKPSLGRLYGLNTLGAMTGTALAGFFLIEFVGVRASLWATAILNLAIGLAAIRMGRDQSSPQPAPLTVAAAQPQSVVPDRLRTLALALLALTAFAALLDEIAWTRVLVMIVGGSTYAFTLVLLVFLLGIGLGSIIVAQQRAARIDTALAAGLAQGITGVGAALLFLFFSFLPAYAIAVFQIPHLAAIGRLIFLGAAVALVVLIPAVGMGMSFPLLVDLTARPRTARAADIGTAYALNSLGSIAGAVLAGFVLVVAIGTQATLRIGLAINGAAALALAWIAARGVLEHSTEHRRLQVRVLSAATLGVLALVAAIAAPDWSTRLIDLGPTIYTRQRMNAAARRAFLDHQGARQLAFVEGRNATVSVWESDAGRSLRVNGKVDASDRGDMGTEVMLGLAPIAARRDAASALVIGYGSGVTARVLAASPGMSRVRIVEIEPAVLAMDSLFHHVNGRVLDMSAVSALTDDARSALQLKDDRFDVIVSEPSNPWIAGIATLYTPEFFHIVRRRLADDGVFCQWVQLYQLPLSVVAGIVRNVRAVFPHVEVWFGESADLLVLGSPQPLSYDSTWFRRLVGSGGQLGDLSREWLDIDSPGQFTGHRLLGERGVDLLIQRATFEHSDDHPRLEFVAARSFLDPDNNVSAVFDSLVTLGAAGGDGPQPWLLARTVAWRRTDAAALPYVQRLRRAEPAAGEFTVREAAIRLAMRDTATAEVLLSSVLARGRSAGQAWADAMLLSGVIATARQEPVQRASTFLEAALSAGADTGQARAALALLAVRHSLWQRAAEQAIAALAAGRGTFRHPNASAFLMEVLTRLTIDGPPALADSVMAFAVARRPGVAPYREMRALAAVRAGYCDVAAAEFIELQQFGVERADGPSLMRECRDSERLRASGDRGTGGTERTTRAGPR